MQTLKRRMISFQFPVMETELILRLIGNHFKPQQLSLTETGNVYFHVSSITLNELHIFKQNIKIILTSEWQQNE